MILAEFVWKLRVYIMNYKWIKLTNMKSAENE